VLLTREGWVGQVYSIIEHILIAWIMILHLFPSSWVYHVYMIVEVNTPSHMDDGVGPRFHNSLYKNACLSRN
jgi:hypothetical protein